MGNWKIDYDSRKAEEIRGQTAWVGYNRVMRQGSV